ncbi:MAG: glycerol kinase GlpK [Myxococcales bacterium]|nr:glycerol kinase GlpK [Myxococcales bacterium]MCB9575621.1 glycerol kinase GlpK [Polyangiaceae bacterium]
MTRHILAIDQGTTGSTALVMGTDGATLGRANHEFKQHFPKPGWVEHEPEEIWTSVTLAIRDALAQAGVSGKDIAAIGITNQRETVVLWDKKTGVPVHRAIVWQDRRTAARCAELKKAGHEAAVRTATGLVIDPYFSGTKLAWLLDEVSGVRARAEKGELAFGTIDALLVYKLTGGQRHVTDVTNASRTLLMDLRSRKWHDGMCELLRVPKSVLPEIAPSAGKLGETRGVPGLPDGIPIAGMAGDQHAALFGQACFRAGEAKCTYGTGAFVLVNTGSEPVESRFGLLSTLGWQIGDDVVYALEGSCFIAGAAVQWLRDGLGLITSAAEIEALARSVTSSEGVTFVPALAGLGAPYWDPEARGLITGITRGTTKAHLARATLEAIALQVNDLVTAMSDDLGKPVTRMRVDGGAAANDLLMQFQSDVSAVTVERPSELESTARGAAMLAGIGAGLFQSGAEAGRMIQIDKTFEVGMEASERDNRLTMWRDAVRRARSDLGAGA